MSKLSRNIVYNGIGQGLSLLLSFVAVRLVFRRLGGDALGLIYFSLTFCAALTVAVQLGVCESAVREVASHHANRPEYIKNLIRTSSLLYWTAFLFLSLIAYAASPYFIRHWVKLGTLEVPTATAIMRILTLGALVALPTGLYRSLLLGLQHMGIINVLEVSGKALQQGGVFLILLMHGSLFQVAYWIAGSAAFQAVAYWIICTRYFSVDAMLVPGFSREVVKENIGYASGLMTITLATWVLGQVDRVVISRLLPLTLLGIYSFARGAASQGALLTTAINGAIFPYFSALHGAGKTDELKSAYIKVQDLICFATIPVFAAVPFAAIPVFSRVFDLHSAHLLLLPTTFLCLGTYMNGTLTAPFVVSLAVGRPDITARQNVIALFVVVPASAFAIYFFGLNGAGFCWVFYHIYAYCYGLPQICRECLGMTARVWYWHVLRILAFALLIYGSAWVIVGTLGRPSIPYFSVAYLLATVLYCTVALEMMGKELRDRIKAFLSPLRLKGRAVTVPE